MVMWRSENARSLPVNRTAMTSDEYRHDAAKWFGLAVLAVLFLLLSGCAGAKTDYEVMKERAHYYVAAHPELAPRTAETIRSNEIHQGMTTEQVVAAWGRPVVVQRFRNGAVQYMFFGCHWPHFCTNPDNDSRSGLFPEPDEIYQSRVLLQNGRVASFEN